MASHQSRPEEGRLIVQGEDRPGIVSAVSSALTSVGANIVSLDQYSSDPGGGRFFQRTVFHLVDLSNRLQELGKILDARLGEELGLTWRLVEARKPKRVGILASKADHCLLDLLWRQRRGEIPMTVPMVISNHPDLGDDVRQFGIPFIHVPVTKDTKAEAEKEHLNLLKGNVDVVVLARYMQILSGDFLDEIGVPVINIHHSFLPAFIGAGPYQKAKERGVKLVGATAHYVTEDLDEGPIIEQDVVRVSHEHTTADLQRRGADVERQVLSRAVAWHCEDRIIRDGNTTVIF
ncbi:formyltetrahydrofolate deformylase [Microbispora sp. H10836]|uniref:formyltetrahydrofolate deformylase n=1 Tax=Microbispora sp. H10836 TaxID=2729106 RepID=UPI0014747F3E|nr:formyltetrahydrofolate deformylase [Microbispora sp. H10836]